ncbi:hypothetical protein LCGC14_2615960 [marine sediment metagenome]|uniref:Uncharacterized protein n=1 Tax=marine sediment metagenome TaxID=412755 RepID=A0A0F9CFJ7_9ZZZZ
MSFTVKEIENYIEAEWDRKPHHKVEWLRMETMIRSILWRRAEDEIPDPEALRLIDKAIAAYTGRGLEMHINRHRKAG